MRRDFAQFPAISDVPYRCSVVFELIAQSGLTLYRFNPSVFPSMVELIFG